MQRFSSSIRTATTSRLATSGAATLMTAIPTSVPRSSSSALPLVMQRRFQYYTDPAKRDHEAFLATYDPLQVLGLPEDATAREVHEAVERKRTQYGGGAKDLNKKKLETVERAYDLLRDVSSPYYTKAGSGDKYRHRLQIDMLPSKNKRMVHFQLLLIVMFVAVGILMILKQVLLPMQKTLRAATR